MLKINKRLTELAEELNHQFFYGILDVSVYVVNLASAKDRKMLVELSKDPELLTKKCRYDFGYSFGEGMIAINSYTLDPGSKMEYGTLVHEMVHDMQDELEVENDGEDGHGPFFESQCYRIGRELDWSDEDIQEYML